MGSADWMPRNLDRRVELVFPIEDPDLKERAFSILDLMLEDTTNARMQLPDTSYVHVERRGKVAHNCQREFSKLAQQAVKGKEKLSEEHPFVPIRSADLKND